MSTANVGLELTTSKSRVACSTDSQPGASESDFLLEVTSSLHFSRAPSVIGTMRRLDRVLQTFYIKMPLYILSFRPLAPLVMLHTDLLDMKCTGLEIHCRFYKKDDRAGVLSKCLCRDRNQKSASCEQALRQGGKVSWVISSSFLPQIESLQFSIG